MIWKFKIDAVHINEPPQTIDIPKNSIPLSVGNQSEDVCIWFQINDTYPMEKYNIVSIGSGVKFEHVGLPDHAEYLGMSITHGGGLVHHVYGWWNKS